MFREPRTMREVIFECVADGERHACEDINGRSMSYEGLRSCVREIVGRLNGTGLRRGDRIATVFTTGPEQLIAIIAISTGFTVVPVNPAVGEEECERFLSEAKVKAIVLESGADCPAHRVALKFGLKIFELAKEGGGEKIGLRLEGPELGEWVQPQYAEEGDKIIVLGTSGTTAKPKLVPYNQINYCWSLDAYNKIMNADGNDRYLVFMPLFHAHGIMPPTRMLIRGGCMVVAPRFDPEQFYQWLDKTKPTLITAGPTNYQAILQHSKENMEIIARNSLRAISTGNAAMPLSVMDELERLFKVPVLESYGSSEYTVMTSNPPPPMKAKRGSAGIAFGNEVAIIDEAANVQPQGKIGEIAVRGRGMDGYENDPKANAMSYVNGWFRTGDVGFFDEEGFLFIRGRVKELINRGGEKIAPREVEDVLLLHPAVREAVVFPIPHPKLGEDVGAAVALRSGQDVSESQLRVYVSGRLAFYKVPSRVVVLAELPKGATGKVTRIGMAERLGLTTAAKGVAVYVPPSNEDERRLVRLLEGVFGMDRVGVKDNFFDLGGHSVMAVKLFAEIEKEFGVKLPLSTLFQFPTVEGLAEFLGKEGGQRRWTPIVPLQTHGSDPPLFLVHGGDGDVINYKELVQALGNARKIYGIQARGLDGREEPIDSMGGIVSDYISEVEKVQPCGPYHLAGFSEGGIIAFEMAKQIERSGGRVAFVGIIDVDAPSRDEENLRRNSRRTALRQLLFLLRDIMPNSQRRKAKMDLKLWPRARLIWRLSVAGAGLAKPTETAIAPAEAMALPEERKRVLMAHMKALIGYTPGDYGGKVFVFRGAGLPLIYPSVDESGWERHAKGGVELHVVPGRIHGKQLRRPNVEVLAARMNESMTSVEKTPVRA